MGLVMMLANMDDPAKIGPAMVAVLSVLYGLFIAELFLVLRCATSSWVTRGGFYEKLSESDPLVTFALPMILFCFCGVAFYWT